MFPRCGTITQETCEYLKGCWFLQEFPDWFLNKNKRPSQGHYTFTTWNYFTKDSMLEPSGLLGPIKLLIETQL